MKVVSAPKFKDGDQVLYLTDNSKLLGPFEVSHYDDGSAGLYYRHPDKVAVYGEDWYGEHVHAIVHDRIVLVGWPKDGAIDPARFRPID